MVPTLDQTLRKQINSIHFRALRLAFCDFKCRVPRWKLTKELKRATPLEWSRYAVASSVLKINRNKMPVNLYNLIQDNLYFERRYPSLAKFFDSSKSKIGKQSLDCRLVFMNSLPAWYNFGFSDDEIRRFLKSNYFRSLN